MHDMILDCMFTEKNGSQNQQSNISGQIFGVPAQITATLWHTHRVTTS